MCVAQVVIGHSLDEAELREGFARVSADEGDEGAEGGTACEPCEEQKPCEEQDGGGAGREGEPGRGDVRRRVRGTAGTF